MVVVWMAGIFYMSHQSKQQSGSISGQLANKIHEKIEISEYDKRMKGDDWFIAQYNKLLRKSAHFFQYFVLGGLLALAVNRHIDKKIFVFLISLSIGILYAASDELHQVFIPGRSGMISDVLIDSAGVLAGSGLLVLVIMFFRRVKRKKA